MLMVIMVMMKTDYDVNNIKSNRLTNGKFWPFCFFSQWKPSSSRVIIMLMMIKWWKLHESTITTTHEGLDTFFILFFCWRQINVWLIWLRKKNLVNMVTLIVDIKQQLPSTRIVVDYEEEKQKINHSSFHCHQFKKKRINKKKR